MVRPMTSTKTAPPCLARRHGTPQPRAPSRRRSPRRTQAASASPRPTSSLGPRFPAAADIPCWSETRRTCVWTSGQDGVSWEAAARRPARGDRAPPHRSPDDPSLRPRPDSAIGAARSRARDPDRTPRSAAACFRRDLTKRSRRAFTIAREPAVADAAARVIRRHERIPQRPGVRCARGRRAERRWGPSRPSSTRHLGREAVAPSRRSERVPEEPHERSARDREQQHPGLSAPIGRLRTRRAR